MAVPTKKEDLEAAGWVFDNEGRCRACGAKVEWWVTPRGVKAPLSVVEVKDETKVFPQPILRIERISHFANCPNAADFRKGR